MNPNPSGRVLGAAAYAPTPALAPYNVSVAGVKRRRRKTNRRRAKLQIDSGVKQNSIDSSASGALQMAPNAATRIFGSTLVGNISLGTALTNRLGTAIKISGIRMRLSIQNAAATDRYLRIVIVGLRGSVNPADTTNWTDLLRDPSSLAKGAPTGVDMDIVQYINKDEYKKYYDHTIKIPGTGSSAPPTKLFQTYKKLPLVVQYEYNATAPKRNPLYVVFFTSETTGTAAGGSFTTVSYAFSTYYNDAHFQ